MTDQQILTKAIEKANQNSSFLWSYTIGEMIADLPSLQAFAKALWPENKCKCGNDLGIPHSVLDGNGVHGKALSWSDYLQMMVLADDPITYLGNNI